MRGGGEGNIGIGGSSGFLNIFSPQFSVFRVFVGSLLLSLTAHRTLQKWEFPQNAGEDWMN